MKIILAVVLFVGFLFVGCTGSFSPADTVVISGIVTTVDGATGLVTIDYDIQNLNTVPLVGLITSFKVVETATGEIAIVTDIEAGVILPGITKSTSAVDLTTLGGPATSTVTEFEAEWGTL